MKLHGKILLSILFLMSIGHSQTSSAPETRPSVQEVAKDFSSYKRMTANPVQVNLELAMLCRGISPDEIEAARSKYGPHTLASIVIFMNDSAAETFGARKDSFPVGSVIVKQKQLYVGLGGSGNNHHTTDNGLGGMIKRSAGYDSEHGDWEYFYFDTPDRIESGRITSCVQCHAQAKGSDFVFGSWSKEHN